jgi:undecaprenyl pyrophosphate synthase
MTNLNRCIIIGKGDTMTPDENAILARLDERTAHIVKELDDFKQTATSEQGFPRCAGHAQGMKDLDRSVTWVKRILLSAIGIPIIGVIIAKFIN